jgi:hypothetical protein
MSEKGWLVLCCAPLFHTFCNFHNLVPCSQCNTDSDMQRIDCGPWWVGALVGMVEFRASSCVNMTIVS